MLPKYDNHDSGITGWCLLLTRYRVGLSVNGQNKRGRQQVPNPVYAYPPPPRERIEQGNYNIILTI